MPGDASPLPRDRRALAVACRFGLLTAAVTALYASLAYTVLRPAHERGCCQSVTAYGNAVDDLIQYPGRALGASLGLGLDHHTLEETWRYTLAVNCLLYFLLGLLISLWRHRAAQPRPTPVETPPATGTPPQSRFGGRRRLLRVGLGLAGAGAAAGLGDALFVEPRWFRVSRRVFPVRGLPPGLDGLRLVQLSDIHHGPWLSLAYVREIVEATNRLDPDVVLLTGDYVVWDYPA